MNSQQELLDAINTISQKKDRSFDTPATVLRVEDDTVWVHIDGGADETPVQRTINCSQGDTVQVRISNGSAFLVGNASAPPTDDSVANVAHFVAEQAEETATKASEEVSVLEVEVEGKVDVGDSNIQHLSSTMYQNANGVNIYNDTLAVGDSYAHIDGDSFDIKKATTAGTIDDANDPVVASFGAEVTIGSRLAGSTVGINSQVFGEECTASGRRAHALGYLSVASGDDSWAEGYECYASTMYDHAEGYGSIARGGVSHAEGHSTASGDTSHSEGEVTKASGYYSHAQNCRTEASGGNSHAQNLGTVADSWCQTAIGMYNIKDSNDIYALIIGNGLGPEHGTGPITRSDALRVDWSGNVEIAGAVSDMNGNYLTPTVLTSTTISASTTTYTFTDSAITADSVVDVYDTIFGFAPTNVVTAAGSCTVTFPAQSSSHQIKLFVY